MNAIDKAIVGRRIKGLREEHGLSQAELADRLGISPQAVSKWESGVTLPDVEILLGISILFEVSINEILTGKDIFSSLANREFITKNNIAYFVPEEENADNIEWANAMTRDGWIKKNWEGHKQNRFHRDTAEKVNTHGGTILEIGAGPGGGFMPEILLEKPEACVILSDLSPTVVREWKKLFDVELYPTNIHYAVLDTCDLPFKDGCMDIVSGAGAFQNIEGGSKIKALHEIYRVLKPGGLYVASDGFVSQDRLKALPEHAQIALTEKFPDAFEDYFAATVAVGFKTIDNKVSTYAWSTANDKSNFSDLARELGVEVIWSGYKRYCVK
ncbi:MAG: helix-turn-helix domain-containing protein [Firmicutes bacterium]|nr:helix-turn-helix domain-containing protein [Bacillota bacterium]